MPQTQYLTPPPLPTLELPQQKQYQDCYISSWLITRMLNAAPQLSVSYKFIKAHSMQSPSSLSPKFHLRYAALYNKPRTIENLETIISDYLELKCKLQHTISPSHIPKINTWKLSTPQFQLGTSSIIGTCIFQYAKNLKITIYSKSNPQQSSYLIQQITQAYLGPNWKLQIIFQATEHPKFTLDATSLLPSIM